MADADAAVGAAIAALPAPVVDTILSCLDVSDLGRLAQTCKALRDRVYASTCWQALCIDAFGSVLLVQSLLDEAGLPLQRRFAEPESYRSEYQRRQQRGPVDLDRVHDSYESVQMTLQNMSEGAREDLAAPATALLEILDELPEHYPSYYSLGYMCFLLNAFEPAEHLVQLGLEIAPEASELQGLLEQIQTKIRAIEGTSEDEVPLLDEDRELSERLRSVLTDIFRAFDRDRDNALNRQELSRLIERTNGTAPSPQVLRALTQRFASTRAGALTLQGFLDFYLEQTRAEPEETIADLAKHGYTRQLTPLTPAPAA